MKKLAIMGASYLQVPLIKKAQAMGIETHVFAWAAGDVGETVADYFHPISIVEKEEILNKCREIGVDGVCSIASDLAAVTVNYVAHHLGLTGNSLECAFQSTNKNAMRRRFAQCGDPSPKSILVHNADEAMALELDYPVIVKPVDRSGSRGITKLFQSCGLAQAVDHAIEQGFADGALVEEFAEGKEYSVECISWQGKHTFLAATLKYTTGAPNFIETGHLEPAPLEEKKLEEVKQVVFHALDSLGITNGASHSELKISDEGKIAIIEIGGRMGGDCIGSDLVYLSTGIDFVKAVIQVALGQEPDLTPCHEPGAAAIRFVFNDEDRAVFARLQKNSPQKLVEWKMFDLDNTEVTDSSNRFGYFIMTGKQGEELIPYLPAE